MSIENTHFGQEKIASFMANAKRLFFIGIGGINMSSLAHIAHLDGYTVAGYDRTRTALTERLAAEGITVYYEEDASHVADADAVVYTVAISQENPEYKAAMARGIPCISRADFLGYLMYGYRTRVGISGMHGKSTTTSMTAAVFMACDLDPTVCSGAEYAPMGGAYRIGGQEHFIFEACEYQDSFLHFYPTIAVVMNIEMDHVDYFHSMEQIRRSYAGFMTRTGAYGIALVNADDDEVMLAAEDYPGKKITFGIQKDADYRAENISYDAGRAAFDVCSGGTVLARIALSVSGEHMVYDALAAFAAGHLCGADPARAAEALSAFGGARRRMEYRGKTRAGADVYDDYAHHPTEMRASLTAAQKMGYRRVVCVFQSHTYSRTAALLPDFLGALTLADEVVIADIYAARETDTLGVSAEGMANALANAAAISDFGEIADYIEKTCTEGDMVITMGAGNIVKVADRLTAKTEK